MNIKHQETKDAIRAELEATRTAFHALIDSLSENDLRRKSRNPGWTNGEILVHMTFGFIILNALLPMARVWGRLPKWTSKLFAELLNVFTVPFNWINALGARFQARVFTYQRIGKLYDWTYFSLVKQINSIKEDEWERGMHYPTRWDSNFSDFMTIRELFHYPVRHFNFHMGQIAQ
ncbi:MAG TPA: DinB family protein [Anaerolineales bacterium]|nr:DinB family protein [Anaerolineales bacterium]